MQKRARRRRQGLVALAAVALAAAAAPAVAHAREAGFEVIETGVIVTPSDDAAAPVRVEVVTADILRVTAEPDGDFSRSESLMRAGELPRPAFEARGRRGDVRLTTARVRAEVSLETGAVAFFDARGRRLLAENDGRVFRPLEIDGTSFYGIGQTFAPGRDDAFYGLGQHQNGQMNYRGEDVELAQHNIAIAMPFVVSTGDYGILWDNTSITRFGDPRPYQPIDAELIVRDAEGAEGGLTGHYYRADEIAATRRESDPDYQYLEPDQFLNPGAPRDVWPEPFGADSPDRIVWTGSIEAQTPGLHKFRVYASSYIKVFIDGALVVDRWRQNWNPYYFNVDLEMQPGRRRDVRIEWIPEGGYFRLLHLGPSPGVDRDDLSLHSEVADVIDYYFIHGETIDDVLSGYRDLTGEAVMLPRWAYGFWQSRQRYATQDELLDALRGYRDRGVPIDNIVLDWFYWPEDAWGSHAFDASRFPDPAAMVDEVHDLDAQIMVSVWPKFYPTTDNYRELEEIGAVYGRNLEMETRDWVGPGYLSTFYDPYSPEARRIYWRQIREGLDALGFDAWWLDATEPDIHSNLSPDERELRMGPTAMGPGAALFNSYALMNARAVYEGERAGSDPNARVFILTRSAFPGIQRYAAAAWSGDIVARWDDLREQIAAGVNFSMSGIPSWTFDIGGFAVEPRYSNEDPAHIDEWRELYLRWFQFGAFAPLFRSHGEYPYREIYNVAHEGTDVYEGLVYYSRLRYRLMPYIYSVAADSSRRGGAIMRGLVMDFEADETTHDVADQYMFGPSFLVAPVHKHRARSRSVYLPEGADWYDFHAGERRAGGQWIEADAPLERMPLFVRAGAVVPTDDDAQQVAEAVNGDLTVLVYVGADGVFDLYEDDGVTYAYQDGAYSRIPFSYDDTRGRLTIGERTGSFDGMAETRRITVRWMTPGSGGYDAADAARTTVEYDGRAVAVDRR